MRYDFKNTDEVQVRVLVRTVLDGKDVFPGDVATTLGWTAKQLMNGARPKVELFKGEANKPINREEDLKVETRSSSKKTSRKKPRPTEE